MKILNIVIALVFFAFAAMQLNDPDPLYWVAVYTATGLIALGRGFGRFSRFWTAVAVGAVLAGMLTAFPSVVDYLQARDVASIVGSMQSASYVEPAREFIGLLLALCPLICYLKR